MRFGPSLACIAAACAASGCARIEPIGIEGTRVAFLRSGDPVPPSAEVVAVLSSIETMTGRGAQVESDTDFRFAEPLDGLPSAPLTQLRGLWSPDPESVRARVALRGAGIGLAAGTIAGLLAARKIPSPNWVRGIYMSMTLSGLSFGTLLGWRLAGPAPERLPWSARPGAPPNPDEPPPPPLPSLVAAEEMGVLLRLQNELDVPQLVGPLLALRRTNGRLLAEMQPVFDRLTPETQERVVGEILQRWNFLRRRHRFPEERKIEVRSPGDLRTWSASVLLSDPHAR